MRLLQLNTNGNEASALDFHPMVTVVNGLSEAGRATVIRAVTALPQGLDPGCHGLLEAHGILLDLDADTLALLDLRGDLDVLVRASDIPGGSGTVAPAVTRATESVLPSAVEPLSVERFLEITPPGTSPALDAAREDQRQSAEARDVLRDATDRARASLAEIVAKRRAAEIELEDARRTLQRANLRLVTDEYEPDPQLEPEPEPEPEPERPTVRPIDEIEADRDRLRERVAEITADIARIDRGIEELAGVDSRPIQVLVDAIRNPQPVEMVPSERAHELADAFVRLQAEVSVLEESLDARGLGPGAATARLDAARQGMAAAEKAMRKPELTEQDRVELEAAHDAVLEFGGKGGRRGGKKRLEEAMAAEQVILDRIGFPTWSAYVMGSGLMAIDSSAERNLEIAKVELEEAEAHWSNVAAMIEADPVHRDLVDQLESVYLEAFDLLGGDDEQEDLEIKLRSLEVPKREVSMDELVDALAYQLELVGMKIPAEAVTLDRTVMIADAFLEEVSAITDRLNELGDEKVAALTELESIDDQLTALEHESEESARAAQAEADADDPVLDLDDLGVDDVDDLDAGAAADDVDDDRATEDDIARLEAELEALLEDEREYVEFVESRDALLDIAIQIDSVASMKIKKVAAELVEQHNADAQDEADAAQPVTTEVIEPAGFSLPERATPEAIEFYLLARLAALRSVSYAGSVPLVIDDALAELTQRDVEHLLHKLERMSESVQIVYLSDDPTVSGWARAIGFERGAVVDAPAAFG